jgi:hypothetical protein
MIIRCSNLCEFPVMYMMNEYLIDVVLRFIYLPNSSFFPERCQNGHVHLYICESNRAKDLIFWSFIYLFIQKYTQSLMEIIDLSYLRQVIWWSLRQVKWVFEWTSSLTDHRNFFHAWRTSAVVMQTSCSILQDSEVTCLHIFHEDLWL